MVVVVAVAWGEEEKHEEGVVRVVGGVGAVGGVRAAGVVVKLVVVFVSRGYCRLQVATSSL